MSANVVEHQRHIRSPNSHSSSPGLSSPPQSPLTDATALTLNHAANGTIKYIPAFTTASGAMLPATTTATAKPLGKEGKKPARKSTKQTELGNRDPNEPDAPKQKRKLKDPNAPPTQRKKKTPTAVQSIDGPASPFPPPPNFREPAITPRQNPSPFTLPSNGPSQYGNFEAIQRPTGSFFNHPPASHNHPAQMARPPFRTTGMYYDPIRTHYDPVREVSSNTFYGNYQPAVALGVNGVNGVNRAHASPSVSSFINPPSQPMASPPAQSFLLHPQQQSPHRQQHPNFQGTEALDTTLSSPTSNRLVVSAIPEAKSSFISSAPNKSDSLAPAARKKAGGVAPAARKKSEGVVSVAPKKSDVLAPAARKKSDVVAPPAPKTSDFTAPVAHKKSDVVVAPGGPRKSDVIDPVAPNKSDFFASAAPKEADVVAPAVPKESEVVAPAAAKEVDAAAPTTPDKSDVSVPSVPEKSDVFVPSVPQKKDVVPAAGTIIVSKKISNRAEAGSTATSSDAASPKPPKNKEPKDLYPTPPPLPGSGLGIGAGPNDGTEFRAPTVVLDIPISGPNTHVNFTHRAEESYGWDALHPRLAAQRDRLARVAAAGAALERNGSSKESGDEMSLDSEGEGEGSNIEMGGMSDGRNGIDGTMKRVPKKRRMKEDEYDKDDGFVDDSELLWEQQAAAANDGFFVYSGPLVPEGENPAMDSRLDGATKRGRGRGGRGGATGTTRKGGGPGSRGGRVPGEGRGGAVRKPRISKADKTKMELEKAEREKPGTVTKAPDDATGIEIQLASAMGSSGTPLVID